MSYPSQSLIISSHHHTRSPPNSSSPHIYPTPSTPPLSQSNSISNSASAHIHSPTSISIFSPTCLKFIDAQILFKDSQFSHASTIPPQYLILSGKWRDVSRVMHVRDLKAKTVYYLYDLNEELPRMAPLPELKLDASSMDVAHFNSIIRQRSERINQEKFCISAAHSLHQFISNWRLLLKNMLQVSLEHQDEIMRISHSGVIQGLKDVVLDGVTERSHSSPSGHANNNNSISSHHIANSHTTNNNTSTSSHHIANSHTTNTTTPHPTKTTLYDVLPPHFKTFHYEKTRSDVLQHFQILNDIKAQFDRLPRTPDVQLFTSSEEFLNHARSLIAEQAKLNNEYRIAQRRAAEGITDDKHVNYASLLSEVAADIDALEKKLELLTNKALKKIRKLLDIYQEMRRIDLLWADHRLSLNRDETSICLAAAKLPVIYKRYLQEMTRRSDFVSNTKHQIQKFGEIIAELRLDENRRRNEFLERMSQSQPLVANILNGLIPEIKESVPEIYFDCQYHEEIPEKYLIEREKNLMSSVVTHHIVESDEDNDYSSEHIGYLENRVQELQEKLKQHEETKQQLVQSLESSTQSLEEKYKSENQALKDRLSSTENELSVLRSSHESELEKSSMQLQQYSQRLETYEKEHISLTQSKLKQVDEAFDEFAQNTKRIHTDYQSQIKELKQQIEKAQKEKHEFIQQIASLERELASKPVKVETPLVVVGSVTKSSLEALLSEKDDLIATLRAQLEKDRHLSESRLDQSIITHKTIEQERDHLQIDNEKLRKRLQESRERQNKSNAMIEELCALVEELKKKVEHGESSR